MTSQVQDVLARSHARRVALKAAFHAPDDRAFECPKEQPKPRGAAVGEATFGGVRRCRFVTRRQRRPRTPSLLTTHVLRSRKGTQAKVPKRRYKGGWKLSERGVTDSLGAGPV